MNQWKLPPFGTSMTHHEQKNFSHNLFEFTVYEKKVAIGNHVVDDGEEEHEIAIKFFWRIKKFSFHFAVRLEWEEKTFSRGLWTAVDGCWKIC